MILTPEQIAEALANVEAEQAKLCKTCHGTLFVSKSGNFPYRWIQMGPCPDCQPPALRAPEFP